MKKTLFIMFVMLFVTKIALASTVNSNEVSNNVKLIQVNPPKRINLSGVKKKIVLNVKKYLKTSGYVVVNAKEAWNYNEKFYVFVYDVKSKNKYLMKLNTTDFTIVTSKRLKPGEENIFLKELIIKYFG